MKSWPCIPEWGVHSSRSQRVALDGRLGRLGFAVIEADPRSLPGRPPCPVDIALIQLGGDDFDSPGRTTLIAGTPNYTAPEVLAGGKVSCASDVWRLGMIMHELLFGQRPSWHESEGRRSLVPVASSASSPQARALFELCLACVDDDPARRPPNAGAVARALAEIERRQSQRAGVT